MSDTKFTKGEWLGFKDGRWQSDYVNDYMLDGDNNPSWVQVTCNGQAVAIIPNHGNTLDANAHLIASAPKMYEILEMLTEMDSSDAKVFIESSSEIVDLLAEARGEL